MSKMTKSLLVLTIAGLASGMVFVTGLVNVGDNVALYIALPAGAIFFGLFLISKMLEKEAALHDEERRLSLASAVKPDVVMGTKACCCEAKNAGQKGALAAAHL